MREVELESKTKRETAQLQVNDGRFDLVRWSVGHRAYGPRGCIVRGVCLPESREFLPARFFVLPLLLTHATRGKREPSADKRYRPRVGESGLPRHDAHLACFDQRASVRDVRKGDWFRGVTVAGYVYYHRRCTRRGEARHEVVDDGRGPAWYGSTNNRGAPEARTCQDGPFHSIRWGRRQTTELDSLGQKADDRTRFVGAEGRRQNRTR